MSQENVEVVQRGIETWNQRDLTTWLALFSSDAEIDWSRARGTLVDLFFRRAVRLEIRSSGFTLSAGLASPPPVCEIAKKVEIK